MNQIEIYRTQTGDAAIEVRFEQGSVWLSQNEISVLFDVQRPAITKHLKQIFSTGELNHDSVSSILEHTAKDGKRYNTAFYYLDAIISVGYRVNSQKATSFRIWATQRLKEYLVHGYSINQERLNQL